MSALSNLVGPLVVACAGASSLLAGCDVPAEDGGPLAPVVVDRAGALPDTVPDGCDATTDCGTNATCTSDAAGDLPSCQCMEGWVGEACLYPAQTTIEEFLYAEPPHPLKWQEHDKTGLRFRHATSKEMGRYGWKPGTFLVEAGSLFDDIATGREDVRLALPIAMTRARSLDLRWVTETEGPNFVEMNGSHDSVVDIDSGRPIFQKYASKTKVNEGQIDLLGAIVTATAVDGDRQLVVHGHVEREGDWGPSVDWVRITPLNSHVELDAFPKAGMSANDMLVMEWSSGEEPMQQFPQDELDLCPPPIVTGADQGEPYTPLDEDSPTHHPCVEPGSGEPVPQGHQCNDGFDNDGDGANNSADPMCEHEESCDPQEGYPEHEHESESGLDYAQFGDIVWCTRHRDSWLVDMEQMAVASRSVMRAPAADNDHYNDWLDGAGRTLRWAATKCWTLPTEDEAVACRDEGACGPFHANGPHDYPYYNTARCYWSQNLKRAEADLHHAVNLPEEFTSIDVPVQLFLLIVSETVHDFGAANQTWGGTSSINALGAVINGDQKNADVLDLGETVAHELGHAFGCLHCDARIVPQLEPTVDEDTGMVLYEETDEDGKSLMSTGNAFEMSECEDDDHEYEDVTVHPDAHRYGPKCSNKIVGANFNEYNSRDRYPQTFGRPIDEVPWWNTNYCNQ